MIRFIIPLAWAGMLIASTQITAKSKDHLKECWNKQVKPVQGAYINFSFTESKYQVAHLSEPWQSFHSRDTGSVWCNGDKLLKEDTLTRWGGVSHSKTQFCRADSVLLLLDYGAKDLSKITRSMFAGEPLDEARYSPALLISYFYEHTPVADKESNKCYAIYVLTIGKTIVKLFVRKNDDLLEKVSSTEHSDLYGDVTNTINYSGFSAVNTMHYPKIICVDKINGKLKDTVIISSAIVTKTAAPILDKPIEYKFTDEKITLPEVSMEKYNDHIHFVTLKHTNGKAMVVEFDDFLLVAEAPLNSENGELIINEARKIAPGKPVRYFVFGHYHPDYIGGVRAFIHQGAKVLCTKGDIPYIEYLANAPHTLQPDSLQLEPHPLQIEEFENDETITDGHYEMKIYLIGKKSEHTNDYLVYYFPAEKLLFEDDLVWINKEGPVKKAGKRQAGLYYALKDLDLTVNTIVQSWPVENYGIKSVMPFSDLEQSVSIK